MRAFAASALIAISAVASAAHAQAPATASPAASATALQIRSQVGGRLKTFYKARGYWPMWVERDALGPQASAFLEILADAGLDGLDPDRYDLSRLRRTVAAADSGAPQALARAELALSETFAEYVRDVRTPELDITYLDAELRPERQRADEVLRLAALAPSFATYVRTMGWMSPFYVRLRAALADEREAGAGSAPAFVPPGPLLKVGAKGERVAMLRRRLGLPAGIVFDRAVATRVSAFQEARGLDSGGIVGPQTLAALNEDPADYRRRLALNLERVRLLPGAWTRHIVVDAATARLWYFDGGAEQGSMRVVVGTPETQTPMMAGMVRYATLNPYWNVPTDLVETRVAPKVLRGASLKSLRMEALSGWEASDGVIDPATVDWRAVASGTEQLRVRELPGRGNSMGSVKFMFPNDLGIYLHDTPDKALFAKPQRQFSNGCIRLEDAPRLGRWMFGHPLAPESAAPEQHVALTRPVPVYLLYLTASPTDRGIALPPDTYHRDAPALDRLASR